MLNIDCLLLGAKLRKNVRSEKGKSEKFVEK